VDYVMHNYEKSDDPTVITICDQIQTVYDPEFALVDVYTLGLIYSIVVDYDEQEVYIVMTYTTPACPE
jgi:metal-sulfur cluster biosynthetic enzyme